MKKFVTILYMLILSLESFSQLNYNPTPENLEAREWFRNAKFGMFIHWGVYSQMAGGGDLGIAEWIMERKQIPVQAYEMLPGFFNPTQFNAEEWVLNAKEAGMNYITITSKHHDGFAIYDSKISDYNIVDATPYGMDILKQLKDACDKHGLKLFFYYSQLDWHHPDYFPRGRTGQGYTGRPENGNWNAYIDYMNAQLTELLTQYGEIGGIWFDGMWDQWDADWQLDKTYSLIHELQSSALIGSNHHKAPFPGEDFQMFERDLPGENTMGFNQTSAISDLPLEMCETMNGSWGYNIKDRRFKSSKTLIQTMVKAAGYGANFLLNTGPMPNGKLQPENIDTLKLIGKWLSENGATIYNTKKGPVRPSIWGSTTQSIDGKTVYIHVLNIKNGSILISDYTPEIKSVTYFTDGQNVQFEKTKYGLVIRIPDDKRNNIDTIIKLDLK